MLEALSVTVRELVLALLHRSPDDRVTLVYQQDLPHIPGSQASWALLAGTPDESDPERFRFAKGTVEDIWAATGNRRPLVWQKDEYIADRPQPVRGRMLVRDLVSRLLDEDPEAPLVMTGTFPLYLRVGRHVNRGGSRENIILQETAVWED